MRKRKIQHRQLLNDFCRNELGVDECGAKTIYLVAFPNMKKLLSILVFLSGLSVAQASIYAGASAGYLFDAEEPLYTSRVGFTLGEWMGVQHNIEAEVGVSSASYGVYEVDMYPKLLNYRGQADLNNLLFLYFGAGAGSVSVDVEWQGISGDGDGFVWQVFGGLGLHLTKHISAIAGARFFDASDITIKGQSIGAENDTEVALGVQFSF